MSINNDGKIQGPAAKDTHDELADELDSILKQETTKLPGSVQSEAEAMMSQLEHVVTTYPVREFNAGTPVAHTIEDSVVEVDINPQAKEATVHETQDKTVANPVHVTPKPTLTSTSISKPLPSIQAPKKERAAMKGLFDPDGKIGAVAKTALPAQQPVKEQEKKIESTPHVIEQKPVTAETKEKTTFGQKVTNFMKKHFPRLSNLKESTRTDKPKETKASSKASNFLQGLKAKFSSTSRAAKVYDLPESISMGSTTDKASKVKTSKVGKMKLGNPLTFIKGKLFSSAGKVKYTEIHMPLTVPIDTHVDNLRDIMKRFDTVGNKEINHLEDYKELHTFAQFVKDYNVEIEFLVAGQDIGIKEDVKRSNLRNTQIGDRILMAETSDDVLEIFATTATQIREILDTPEYEI